MAAAVSGLVVPAKRSRNRRGMVAVMLGVAASGSRADASEPEVLVVE